MASAAKSIAKPEFLKTIPKAVPPATTPARSPARAPVRPKSYSVVEIAAIPEPLPADLPRQGYFATVFADLLVLPAEHSLFITFETREAGDYFATQLRQQAKRGGTKLICEVRSEGLHRYFRVAPNKPSFSTASLKPRTREETHA